MIGSEEFLAARDFDFAFEAIATADEKAIHLRPSLDPRPQRA